MSASESTLGSTVTTGSDQSTALGRGAGRGLVDVARGGRAREFSSQLTRTRPTHADSKTGQSGTQVTLKANVFRIDELKDFEFNQYRVDFEPDLDMVNIRKALFGKNISKLGGKEENY